MGTELFEKLKRFLNFAHEVCEVHDGVEKSEAVLRCIEMGDHLPLVALAYDLATEIFEYRRRKVQNIPDALNTHKALYEILSGQYHAGETLFADVCEGIIGHLPIHCYIWELWSLSEQLRDEVVDRSIENLLSCPPQSPHDVDPAEMLFANYCGFDSVLADIRSLVTANGFGRLSRTPLDMADFAQDLTLEVLEIGRLIGIPPIISDQVFAGTKAEEYQLGIHSMEGLGKPNIFGSSNMNLYLYSSDSEFGDITKEMLVSRSISTTQTSVPIFFSAGFSNVSISHAGEFYVMGSNLLAPFERIIPQRSLRRFFLHLKVHLMQGIHDLLEDLFEQIKDLRGSETTLELPKGYKAVGEETQQSFHLKRDVNDIENDIEARREIRQKVQMPALTANRIVRSLTRLGCKLQRQTGSHIIIKAPNGASRPIPQHGKKTIGIGLLISVLKAFDLDRTLFIDNL